jgi:integrase/DNA-directed RNA polymerase subunit RPC12/RpoP
MIDCAVSCPECGSGRLNKDGLRYTNEGQVQRYLCLTCGYRFSEAKVKVNVAGKVGVILDSGADLSNSRGVDANFSVKESSNGSAFSFGKDVGAHDITTAGKRLNIFSSYNSNRQICAIDKRAKNLETAIETKTIAGEEKETTKGKILQFAFYLKLQGCSEHTIKGWSQKLNLLARNADLTNPESVKKFLAYATMAEISKHAFCVAYTSFLKWQGKIWKPPKYKGAQKIPEFIPTEKEIDALIAGCGKKTSTILQTLKETGMRIGECLSLKWSAINSEARTITLNTPEKNSLPRIFKVSTKLLGMLEALPKKSDNVFGNTNRSTASVCLSQQRKKIARKLQNPRIAKIHFHLIRHWKGTMEYHKTQNIIAVQKLLGHKSILNTQIYINLEQAIFELNDDYEVKVAETLDAACKLLEVGFEYVCDMDGRKLFRKRK